MSSPKQPATNDEHSNVMTLQTALSLPNDIRLSDTLKLFILLM